MDMMKNVLFLLNFENLKGFAHLDHSIRNRNRAFMLWTFETFIIMGCWLATLTYIIDGHIYSPRKKQRVTWCNAKHTHLSLVEARRIHTTAYIHKHNAYVASALRYTIENVHIVQVKVCHVSGISKYIRRTYNCYQRNNKSLLQVKLSTKEHIHRAKEKTGNNFWKWKNFILKC